MISMFLRSAVIVLALTATSACSGEKLSPDAERFAVNYAVTPTIEYRGEQYSGTAVWRNEYLMAFQAGLGDLAITSVSSGEAIPVEIPDLGTVFVLRRSSRGTTTFHYDVYSGCVDALVRATERKSLLETYNGVCTLSGAPMLVMVDDTQPQPQIVRIPRENDDPDDPRIVGVEVRRTESPMSTGLIDRYPWISDLPDSPFPGEDEPCIGSEMSMPLDRFYSINFSSEIREC